MASYTPGSIASILAAEKTQHSDHTQQDSVAQQLFKDEFSVSSVKKEVRAEQKLGGSKPGKKKKRHHSTIEDEPSSPTPKKAKTLAKGEGENETEGRESKLVPSKKKTEEKVVSGESKRKKKKKRKEKKLVSLPEETPERKARTVFIGNLPTSVDKKVLLKKFSSCGHVESVRLRSAAPANPKVPLKAVIIRKEFHSERKSLNAYVVFAEEGSVDNALKMNGDLIGDLHIRVDRASGKKQYDHKHCVFVGNLPLDAEEEDLREHFSGCGDINYVRIIRDQGSGMGKGFGYVAFNDRSAMQLALNLNDHKFGGRKLRVKRSTANPDSANTSSREQSKMKRSRTDSEARTPQKKKKFEENRVKKGHTEKEAETEKNKKKFEKKEKSKREPGLASSGPAFHGTKAVAFHKMKKNKKRLKKLQKAKQGKKVDKILGQTVAKVSAKAENPGGFSALEHASSPVSTFKVSNPVHKRFDDESDTVPKAKKLQKVDKVSGKNVKAISKPENPQHASGSLSSAKLGNPRHKRFNDEADSVPKAKKQKKDKSDKQKGSKKKKLNFSNLSGDKQKGSKKKFKTVDNKKRTKKDKNKSGFKSVMAARHRVKSKKLKTNK